MAVTVASACRTTPASMLRRQGRRQPCLAALFMAAAAIAALGPPARAQVRSPWQGGMVAKKTVMKPPNFTPARRTPQAMRTQEDPAAWFDNIFGFAKAAEAEVQSQPIGLQSVAQLLMAMGSVVGAAALADGAGLIYVADVLDVLDAQAILSEGQAVGAEVNLDENLVNLQLALQDGTKRIITLFTK